MSKDGVTLQGYKGITFRLIDFKVHAENRNGHDGLDGDLQRF